MRTRDSEAGSGRFPRSPRNAFIAAVIVLAPWVGSATSDTKPEAAQATFTSRSELVLVPAVVSDKAGAHVTGLKKEEFTVLENGAEQKIATFEEVNSDPARAGRRAPTKPGEFTNEIIGDSRSMRRVTVIVFDLLNTGFPDQAYARSQLLKYLSQSLDRREPTGLYLLNIHGLHVVHDFTGDPEVLIAAVKKALGEPMPAVDTGSDLQAITGSTNPVGSETGGVTGVGSGPAAPPANNLLAAILPMAASL